MGRRSKTDMPRIAVVKPHHHARVRIGGQAYWLGKCPNKTITQRQHAEAARLWHHFLKTGMPPEQQQKTKPSGQSSSGKHSVKELADKYLEYAATYYQRADGTPTYMLAVVVDDHDMGITHVIRGDDHLTNAFRQTQIFNALGWTAPVYAHIPLIHGADGAKLSKRHGALGVDAYRDMGYLPEAVLNYLCRLGWSHGDEELFSMEQAVEWFDIADVNKGAARFDFERLSSLNAKYIDTSDNPRLIELAAPGIEKNLGKALTDIARQRLATGMDSLKSRAETIPQLVDLSMFYCFERPLEYTEKAAKILDSDARTRLGDVRPVLEAIGDWNQDSIEAAVKEFATANDLKLGLIAQPLRAALTGTNVSPGIFEVAAVLGRDESLGRISDAATQD